MKTLLSTPPPQKKSLHNFSKVLLLCSKNKIQGRIFFRRLTGSSLKYCQIIICFSCCTVDFIFTALEALILRFFFIVGLFLFEKLLRFISFFAQSRSCRREKNLSSSKCMEGLSVRSTGGERDAPDQNALGVSQEGQKH